MTEQHQGSTVEDIAGRIAELDASLLDAPELNEPGDAPEDGAAPEAKKNSPPEQGDTPQAGEEEEPEKDEDEEPGEKEEPEKDESASEEDDPVFEITLADGSTKEVPLSELANSHAIVGEVETLKAEAAEQKRLFESRMQEIPYQVQQAVQHRENELVQLIEQYAQANPLGEPPSAHLLDPNSPEYNPDSYHYEMAQYQARRQHMQAAANELQKIAQQREQQQLAHEAQEREKLKAAWPEVVEDSAKQAAFLKQVEDQYGLTRDDIATFNDHRAFLVLRDAVAYRAMKTKAPNARQKVKAKPKPVKPGIRKTQGDVQKADLAEQRKRLRKSGRPEDAMAFLENMPNL